MNDQAESLPSAGVKESPPSHFLVVLCNDGARKGDFSNFLSERRNDTAGKKCLSPAEGGNVSDDFSLFQNRLP